MIMICICVEPGSVLIRTLPGAELCMGNQFYRRVFDPDCGVLQLIRVLEMRDGDWERLLNYLSTSYPCEYSEDGVVVSLPSIDEIIGTRKKVSTFLEFDIDGTRVSSHFPDRHRVQIDLRP